jgi:hypothetical protein
MHNPRRYMNKAEAMISSCIQRLFWTLCALCAGGLPAQAATICLAGPQGGFINQQGRTDPRCGGTDAGAVATLPSQRQVLPVTLAPVAAAAQAWTVKPAHHSLQQLIEDWAASAGYEVYFKTRDFPLSIKSEKVISTGDFWAALTLLGESYRNSDAPFQIQPTDFRQIIIYPMRTPKSAPLP